MAWCTFLACGQPLGLLANPARTDQLQEQQHSRDGGQGSQRLRDAG